MSLPVLSRYERCWRGAAVAAAAGFALDGVVESPPGPLFLFVLGLAVVGGAMSVRDRITEAAGLRQCLLGAGLAAGVTLVLVGCGHHLLPGLCVATVLGVLAPWPWRWLRGDR